MKKLASLLFVLGLVLTSCQTERSDQSTNGSEGEGEGDPEEVSAGSVGECIPIEVYPGYSTCVMDEAQDFQTGTSKTQQALGSGDLPSSVNHRNYIDANCPDVHSQGRCGWCVAHADPSCARAAWRAETQAGLRAS